MKKKPAGRKETAARKQAGRKASSAGNAEAAPKKPAAKRARRAKGGGGDGGPPEPPGAAFDPSAQNFSQCAPEGEQDVWVLQDEKGRLLGQVPARPRDGIEALRKGFAQIPAWDEAAREEAYALRRRFLEAWRDICYFAQRANHGEGREILGHTLGRFWAELVVQQGLSRTEWNDFTALYYGWGFFAEAGQFSTERNDAFRKAYDKKSSSAKRGDPYMRQWVKGELILLEAEGRERWLEGRGHRRMPALPRGSSPAWTREMVEKYAERGFDWAVLELPCYGEDGVFEESAFGFENLWAELLEPHFDWAWPQFLQRWGGKVNGGGGYKRKDFGNHAKTVKKRCEEWLGRWDGLGG